MINYAKLKHAYGWIPDFPDQRDFPYISLALAIPLLPKAVDLRKYCTSIENQLSLGSCTAFALVGNLEYIKQKKVRKDLNFSKLFLYYNERVMRNNEDFDSGASLRDGIKSLVKKGDCLEKFWPYKIRKFRVKPPEYAYENALDFQIKSYYRITALSEMKHTISQGFPFVFGFGVYESFESEIVARTGMVPLPRPDETVLGGHAVMAVGYDDGNNYFIVRNSWGKDWGDGGYFYMPYDYLANRNLSSDFWTIRVME